MRIVFFLFLLLLPADSSRAGDLPSEDFWDRVNYSLGYQIGGDLKRQGTAVDPAQLASGLEDAFSGRKPRLEQGEMNLLLAAIKQRITEDKRREIAARSDENAAAKEKYRGEGRDFLAANGARPGVISLPSGLQYSIVSEGSGKSPGPRDTVTVRYRGTLIDGTEFGGTMNGEPEKYRVDAVMPGWIEALQRMKEGGKWRLFVPADLAFGERGPLADRTLIFDLELLAIDPED